jgi:hypothetical protein
MRGKGIEIAFAALAVVSAAALIASVAVFVLHWLIQIKQPISTRRTLAPMAGIDWQFLLLLAATLALTCGAMCVILFEL